MRIDIEPVPAHGSSVVLPNVEGYRWLRAIHGERDGQLMIVGFWVWNDGEPDMPPEESA